MAVKVTRPSGNGSITDEFSEATGYEVIDNCLILFRPVTNGTYDANRYEIFMTFAPGAWLYVWKGLHDDGK
jgi:hypothetical protein